MSDPRVEEAQIWLNSVGEDIPGYIPCDTDGQTGQGTIRSFIMVLQYTLYNNVGYPGTVDGNFGPGTYDLMVDYGDIQEGHYSAFMGNFVRHALWCKGYSGGYVEDEFSAEMGQSVANMRVDAGLSDDPILTPKLMRALLNTDPYVLIDGGNTQIQEAQRYLNGKYIHRENFFIGPCEGYGSRGLQKNIVMGIQFEAGMTDSQADGLFGPGTSAAMQNGDFDLVVDPNNFSNDPDIVCLFTTACLMNDGNFANGLDPLQFSGVYTSDLADFVAAFQRFSALQRTNGTPDFNTWAQLLVSSGNRDRTHNVHACDLITTITPSRGQALYNADYRVVGRYLHEHPDTDPEHWLDKEIQPGELDDLFGAGLRCFPIWQYAGTGIDSFTYEIGKSHGELAHQHATRHGFDLGTTIYFAVDYDALDAEIDSNIIPYFRGVEFSLHKLGNKYHPGIYAGRNGCIQVGDAGLARLSFVSGMSWGFSGNLGYPLPDNWTYNQIKEWMFDPADHGESGDPFGLDNDVLRPGFDRGVDHTQYPMDQAELVSLLSDLYAAIDDNGFTPPYESRINNETLIRDYLASPQYPDSPWRFSHGAASDWLAYARAEFGDPPPKNMLSFADGLTISIPKMFASARVDYGSASSTYRDKYGWAGDLSRLYSQWRLEGSGYSSGSEFVDQNCSRLDVDSCFSLPDFIADGIGYLLYTGAHDVGLRYDEALEAIFSEGVVEIPQQFFAQRWGASQDTLRSSSEAWLFENADDDWIWRKEFLLRYGDSDGQVDPPVAGAALNSFLDGFTQRVIDLTNGDF
ncbi:glycoside hydrolase domain-containing protein [Glycomyces salinus]|uniref:glycoside hydrolase domain-containing protein n=1 Tax=Glycomyces salinus TaxID=980294 RepID=UPI0018EBD20F|nr:glycoside hydrolase domain-containing protein [Glycomyces salinus]